MLLNRTQASIADSSKCKSQFEANITAIWWCTSVFGNWSNPPDLAHSYNHTGDTEAESSDGSNTDWELAWLVIIFWAVILGSAAEEEVFGEADTAVDGKPVANKVHEVFKDLLKVRVPRNSNGDISTSTDESPDEAWDNGGPSAKNLHGEGHAVDVWNIVSDDGEGEDNQAELSESTKVRNEDGSKETTNTSLAVTIGVDVIAIIDGGGRHDNSTEDFAEQEWEDQACHGGEEDANSVGGDWLIASVIGSIRAPAYSETEDNGTK